MVPIDELLSHARFVRGLTRSLVSDAHLAEDLEQETWAAALENPPRSGVRAWFRAVARNLAADAFRSKAGRLRRETKAARPEAEPATADVVAKESTLREVLEAVLALDPLHREVILLRFYEDLPPREIAARLGVPVNTVRSRLIRAIAELRERLDRRHGGRRDAWILAIQGFTGTGAAVAVGVIMGTGAKVAVAAAVAMAAGGAWWFTRPQPADPAPPTVVAVVTPKSPPVPRPDPSRPMPSDAPAPIPGTMVAAGSMTVVGVIVDQEGKPVPGSRLTLGISDPRTRKVTSSAASVEGDGTFRVEVPTNGAHLSAEADGFLPSALVSVTGRAGEERTVRLELPGRSAVVAGRVLDTSGTPLPKVVVGTFSGNGRPSVRSDDMGRFRLEGFPAGVQTEIYAFDRTHSPWHDYLTVEPGAVKEIEIRLPEAAVLAGIVRDTEGTPAKGVTVKVISFRWAERLYALTDAEGRYRIEALMGGWTGITADGGERGKATAQVELKAGEGSRWDPVLSRGAEVRGRLVDGAGKPIAGWKMMVRPEILAFGTTGDAMTDTEGRFVVPNLTEGTYRLLAADGPGKLPSLDLRGVRTGPEPREYVIPEEARPTASIVGRLCDADGRSIPDGWVLVVPAGEETWWASGSCRPDKGTGRFEGGPFPPGRYRLRVGSPTFGMREIGIRDLLPGKALDLGTLAMEPPGTAVLRFSIDKAEPAIQADWMLDRRRPDGTWLRQSQDRVKGEWHLPLGPGAYRLLVNGIYARGQQREFEIRSGEETRLEFRVEHAPMRFLRVSGPSSPMRARVMRLRAYDTHGALQYEANIGRNEEEDFFRAWAYLVPGTYEIVLTPDQGEETRATMTFEEKTALTSEDAPAIRLR